MSVRELLESRAAMEKAVRDYFDSEGFLEVTTPAALPCPNLDPNIAPCRFLFAIFPVSRPDTGSIPLRNFP